MLKHARNVAIIAAIAAAVVIIPGGGTGANVVAQTVSVLFLAAIGWVATLLYREHRVALYSLGDRRRTILYVAVGVATLTLTATSRLWHTGRGPPGVVRPDRRGHLRRGRSGPLGTPLLAPR